MSPGKIQLKTVAAKAELIREMLAAIETLPLASEADFSADPRMVAAGESFLRRSLEALLDLGPPGYSWRGEAEGVRRGRRPRLRLH
ncbi:MAG TPA: hypothetical protein VGG03_06220 [Thermoanaerobaculia bacterium]|jgi:hypothetical protein